MEKCQKKKSKNSLTEKIFFIGYIFSMFVEAWVALSYAFDDEFILMILFSLLMSVQLLKFDVVFDRVMGKGAYKRFIRRMGSDKK